MQQINLAQNSILSPRTHLAKYYEHYKVVLLEHYCELYSERRGAVQFLRRHMQLDDTVFLVIFR